LGELNAGDEGGVGVLAPRWDAGDWNRVIPGAASLGLVLWARWAVGPLGGGWCGDKGGTPLLRRGGWIGRRQGRDALAAAGWGDADWKVRDPLDVRCPVKARVGGG
jgi:hypothetical protein